MAVFDATCPDRHLLSQDTRANVPSVPKELAAFDATELEEEVSTQGLEDAWVAAGGAFSTLEIAVAEPAVAYGAGTARGEPLDKHTHLNRALFNAVTSCTRFIGDARIRGTHVSCNHNICMHVCVSIYIYVKLPI